MKKNCVICGKPISGWGNNPRLVKDTGRCCTDCNMEIVLPARLRMIKDQYTNRI